MAVATRPRFTSEDKAKIDQIISLMQTGGQKAEVAVDRDFLLEDGNAALFFLHYFGPDFEYRWEMVNTRLIDFLETNTEGMWWLPGGIGKTTSLLRWIIYVAVREPQISFIYVEKNQPTAEKRSNAILGQLEGNKLLINDFGEFKNDKMWSAKQWTIRQRPNISDWPTFACYGTKGAALGNRCNIFIGDDLVTTENSESELMRNSIESWWSQAASTCPSPLPLTKHFHYLRKLLVGGTVFHNDDLFHRILKRDPDLPLLHLPAVDAHGQTLSPRFAYIDDPEALKKQAETDPQAAQLLEDVAAGRVLDLFDFRAKKGSVAFNQRYMNRVSDPSLQKFPEIWFRGGKDDDAPMDGYPGCLDKTFSLGGLANPDWKYVTGVDPQSGTTTKTAARFVCVTLGADPKYPTDIHLADITFGRFPLESDNPQRQTQCKTVLDHVKRYNSRIAIETNNVQHVYVGVFRKAAREMGMTISISGHWTTKRQKVDPNVGIEAMQPMVENGQFRLPYVHPSDQRKVDELIDEFVNLGVHPTNDIVMATWFAWRVLTRTIRNASQGPLKPEPVPVYRNYRPGLDFPSHWTEDQIDAYLNGGPVEDEEIEEL